MKMLTAKQMLDLDKWAIEKIGIPQIVLMENAGKSIADEVLKLKRHQNVLILVHKGNNGGDGLVAARYLSNCGCKVTVVLLGDEKQFSNSSQINLNILKNLKSIIITKSIDQLKTLLPKADIVIDAIFGLGFKGEIEGRVGQIIDLINQQRKACQFQVIAVDVPSGVDATTGKVSQHAIKADITVTFSYPKTGLLKYPAIKNVGKLIVANIGIPEIKNKQQTTKTKQTANINQPEYYIPQREVWTHKGSYGKVLIIAGSKNMSGAAYLSAQAALRSGAGLVYLAVPKSIQNLVAVKSREIITLGLAETKEGTLSLKALDEILKVKADVIAMGPGITTNPETIRLVHACINKIKAKYLILDADALNAIANDPSILKQSKTPIIITPHPGEFSRLIGKNTRIIEKNRVKFAGDFANKYQVEVVLKGAYTIVVNQKNVSINSSGNPGMASAGAGDVLTGIIAGFKAQGFATELAVYVHGLAGDLAAREKGQTSLIAKDIIEKIANAIQAIN